MKFYSKLPTGRKFIIAWAAIICCLLMPHSSEAHQQPTTIVLFDVYSDRVSMELQIPLSELELAFGHEVSQKPEMLIGENEAEFKNYLIAHIHPETPDGQFWSVQVKQMKIEDAVQTRSGPYQEITVQLELMPPNAETRHFVLNYDVIMHQVVSHLALVGVRKDWETGKTGEQPATVGYIKVDTASTQIFPLEVDLQKGSRWEGFKGMVSLGMRHFKERTEHLLFLLVLLLPATLLVRNNQWAEFGGGEYSVKRLLKIVTAFSVGYSITLIIGALGWLRLPTQAIEILITFSILTAAVHAVRPIFFGREMSVAAGFGLVQGLAFAAVLSDLHLEAGSMALSILGFNIGIELMQIFVIALVMPWLILLSLTPFYKWFRMTAALLAGVVAAGLIIERVFGSPNAVGAFVQNIAENASFGILGLAAVSLLSYSLKFADKKHAA